MSDQQIDPVQSAVEASFPLFEQNTDMPLLMRRLAEFRVQHIGAFNQVSSPSHQRLMTQFDNIYGFIRKDCQDITDMDAYFVLITACLKDIPLSANIFDELIAEIFSPKFEYLTDNIRKEFLDKLADNLINFDTLNTCHAISVASMTPRTPDCLLFETTKQERNTLELLHWIADSNDPLVFDIFGERVLSHIFKDTVCSPVYNPGSLALWICIDHERRRVSGNLRNNTSEKQSKMVEWFKNHEAMVASSVINGTWSTKYHRNYILHLKEYIPDLKGIEIAMTLRSFDQRPEFLLDLMHSRGVKPDHECIGIQIGKYDSVRNTSMRSGLQSLMAYSLVFENILEGLPLSVDEGGPVDALIDALETVRKKGLVIDRVAFESLAMSALDAMGRHDDINKVLSNELLRPFLKKSRHFQGIRLEQALGI